MKIFTTKTEIEKFIQNEELDKTFIFDDEEVTLKITAIDTLIFINEDNDLQVSVNTATKKVSITLL